jgi:hypothetical protein
LWHCMLEKEGKFALNISLFSMGGSLFSQQLPIRPYRLPRRT